MMGRTGGLAALGLALAVIFGAPAGARAKVGEPAPHYVVRLFDGTRIDSTATAGNVVIVNRWAAWCGPCRAEIPALDAYARAHAKDGLRIFASTIDDSANPVLLRKLSAMLGAPLAWSVGSAFPDLGGVPTSYVIDRHGIVRYAKAAAFDADSLDAVVGPLLAEPR